MRMTPVPGHERRQPFRVRNLKPPKPEVYPVSQDVEPTSTTEGTPALPPFNAVAVREVDPLTTWPDEGRE